MTRAGKGGTALGITMICSFFAASVGIIVMIFASPLFTEISFKFGPTEIFSIMLLGLLAGSTMSRGSPLKGVAMTLFGLICGCVGTDVNSGTFRRSLLLSRGDMMVFVHRPISCVFVVLSALLLTGVTYSAWRASSGAGKGAVLAGGELAVNE